MRVDHPAAGCGLTKTTLEGRTMKGSRTKRPINPGLVAARLRFFPPPRPMDAEEVPIGSLIRTPSGKEARVIGYRGFKRDIRVRLVCRYTQPENKRFDVVLLAPELVMVLVEGGK
jgi:hypothetical protein